MSRLFNNQFSSQKDGAYPFFSRTGRSNNLNAFGRANQYRSPSFYDPSSRLHTLTSLCNDIISTRDNYSSPLKYAQFVIMSVLDNMDVDLFQILPKYDREHEQLTHQLGCLIGHDSPTFKVTFIYQIPTVLTLQLIFLNEDLFEYFMENFTKHAELSNAGFGSASSSLYIWLLNGYLQRLLPTSDTVLASVQFSTWFTSQTPKRPLKKMLKTPFQLLRRDLLTVASDSFEDSLEFDQSNYARLFQFVELLMSSYANTSISPSPAQIVSLKTVVESYTKFLLTPTAEKELETFKSQLRANKQFSHVMYGYLKSMLSNNALNESFVYHFGNSPPHLTSRITLLPFQRLLSHFCVRPILSFRIRKLFLCSNTSRLHDFLACLMFFLIESQTLTSEQWCTWICCSIILSCWWTRTSSDCYVT